MIATYEGHSLECFFVFAGLEKNVGKGISNKTKFSCTLLKVSAAAWQIKKCWSATNIRFLSFSVPAGIHSKSEF